MTFGMSGCALYSPYQVFRFTADYNTERRLSMQGEVFEHLPSHPVRVRLNQWAYNVGPQVSTSSIPIPASTPVNPIPAVPAGPPKPPDPGLPSLEPAQPDLLDESQPPPFPPAPRTDLRSEQPGNRVGPSARANGNVRGASYQVPASPSTTATPAGAWLFTP